MKMIIAHLPNGTFEAARTELNDLGVLRITMSEVHSTSAQPAITLRYRGAIVKTHLRAELRLECVATNGQSPAVIDVLCGLAGPYGQVAALDIEDLHPHWQQDDLFCEDPRRDAAVH